MNWDAVMQGAMIGGVVGAVVGSYFAWTVMTKRKQFVVAELAARGLTATKIAGDWFHLGIKARFRVELEHEGRAIQTAARVDRHGKVTWEFALPG